MKPVLTFSRLLLLVMVISALLNAHPARAAALSVPKGQSGIELENVTASSHFGEAITFVATIRTSVSIQSVAIVISDESQHLNHVATLTPQADGRTEFRLDTRQAVLRPFTMVKWNYQFTLTDGSVIQSEAFYVRYADDRFQWQTLESGTVRVNWYAGDANFGQAALNAIQTGLGSISQLMAVALTQPIEVYIYANTDDLQGTLNLGGDNWVAGHADPALGVMMVVVEPGAEQGITMDQRLPHELMHIMMYRSVGPGYYNIPMWLREGMASLAVTYPNTDYERALASAAAENTLIPLKDLCTSFPADQRQAFLAYAEARSFTSYLYSRYGSMVLLSLINEYANGVDCEHGPARVPALGASLANLEMTWRSSELKQNTLIPALGNISPYLVLLCLILIVPFIGIVVTLRNKGDPHESES